MTNPQITICCLLYGDYPDLAKRLLRPLIALQSDGRVAFRIGINDVSSQTLSIVRTFCSYYDANVLLIEGQPPYYKYPMMRRMVHGNEMMPAIKTPYTMWFDDDSYIGDKWEEDGKYAHEDWIAKVLDAMKSADMIGAPYQMRLIGQQAAFIRAQPWYNDKPLVKNAIVKFITGGWWTIKTEILRKHHWPPASFEHNGGDVMLGEMCRQQGYKLRKFMRRLGINADTTGKCSSARRRGFSQEPIGNRLTTQQQSLFPDVEG